MSQFRAFRCNLETFIEDLESLTKENLAKIEELLDLEEKTYQNFVKVLEDIEEELSLFFTPLSHLNSVKNSDKTQEVYTKALEILTHYSTQISQDIRLYHVYKEIFQKEQNTLNGAQKRVLELNIQSFELSGAHLDDETKEKLAKINLRKSELSNQFSQNLLDATAAYELVVTDPKDVEGIPQSDLANAEFEEDGIKKWRFTLQIPSYLAYMTYGPNEKLREELYRAYTTRAPQNAAIIDELMALRKEMAQLLGFENYAQYSLETKMATSPQEVVDFLEELLESSKEQGYKEVAELEAFAKKKLSSWDVAFYSEQLKKSAYDIDEEEYRVYFEKESVVGGMFDFLKKLFNITFEAVDEELWDEKAYSYDLYLNGALQGRLYLDLEARKEKRGGAWMDDFQTRTKKSDGSVVLPSAFVVCNFPQSSEKTPSLLRHDDVVTLFHEMGHALHHLLSQVDEAEVSGVHGVEWDAVEFPSQFLENFAYEKSVLQLFAKHYQTKEVLPDSMIEKLIRAKNFQSAMAMLRQLEFGLFDMLLHIHHYQGEKVQELLETLRQRTAPIKPPSYNRFQNSFGHIFAGGYAAGYYSYKWAEVLSADAFMAIADKQKINQELAIRYKEVILYNGGSKSMKELYKEFMQREPKVEPLLELSGIK